jgi:hypothetical protein
VDATKLLELARRFPEVTLKEGSSWTSIRYRTHGFAWVRHDDDLLMLKSTHDERSALVGSDPETFSEGWASATTAWVTIRLDRVEADEVFELVAEAWRLNAPRRVIAAFDAAHPDGLP